jgi:hypothetical protein
MLSKTARYAAPGFVVAAPIRLAVAGAQGEQGQAGHHRHPSAKASAEKPEQGMARYKQQSYTASEQ